jgi:hypothetical protein
MGNGALTKRRILALLGTSVIVLTAACGGESDESASSGAVTLEFTQWWEPELPDGSLRALMDEFEEQNPGITVELLSGPYASTKEQVVVTGLFGDAMRFHWAHQLMNLHFLVVGYLFFSLVVGVAHGHGADGVAHPELLLKVHLRIVDAAGTTDFSGTDEHDAEQHFLRQHTRSFLKALLQAPPVAQQLRIMREETPCGRQEILTLRAPDCCAV